MTYTRTLPVAAVGLAFLAGCSENDSITSASFVPALAKAPVVDISGEWNWTRLEHLTMPAWVAETVAGIQPEGPVTQIRCESAGTMTLVQTGAAFTGSETTTSITCETRGGQQFQPSDAFVPASIENGAITGGSIKFILNNVIVTPCPHHAVIVSVVAGVATTLEGGGRCFVPGHPNSASPIDLPPPQAGTSKTLNWQAVRP